MTQLKESLKLICLPALMVECEFQHWLLFILRLITENNKVLLIEVGIQISCCNLGKLYLKVFPGTNQPHEVKAMKTEDLANQLNSLTKKYYSFVLDLPKFFLINN